MAVTHRQKLDTVLLRIENGKRVYTLSPEHSESVNPAKYSIEDKFSDERITMKMRHKIFPFDE